MDGEIVVCDPTLMHRALVNIVRNGIEAMRDGGGRWELRVGVERRWLPDPSGAARSYTALIVRDGGPGIPSGVMERMFNPFFTTRATGTGLGLAIVHRIMDAHAGRVLVRNFGRSLRVQGERVGTAQMRREAGRSSNCSCRMRRSSRGQQGIRRFSFRIQTPAATRPCRGERTGPGGLRVTEDSG